ncbi:MAG: type IV toxin-antitoxin system AbiEi family antitoxin domain-containing protein [Candidatus Eisenbacteria bacterium]
MPCRDLKHDVRQLARAARDHIITLPEAARELGLQPRAATRRMARLAQAGWVRRIRRGVFVVVPVNSPSPREEPARSPEALAEALFAPCYLGGWSAAAHWGLPRVKRRAIFVVTAARVRHTSVRAEGFRYHLVHAPIERVQGAGIITQGYASTNISGPERTIVDALCRPGWIGGAIYLADALRFHCFSDDWDEEYFAEIMTSIGTGAAHKRLGMLLEVKSIFTDGLLRLAREGRTSGVVDLEPGSPRKGPILSFWGVRRNADLRGWDLPDEDAIEDDFIEGVDDPDP